MTDISLSTKPDLRHLSVVADGHDDFVVGNGARFINVPEMAATVIRMLDGSTSILEATVRIHNDQTTDVDVEQFVRSLDGQGLLEPAIATGTFASLSRRVATWAFNPVVYALAVVVWATAGIGVATQRIALPGYNAVLWNASPALSILGFTTMAWVLVFLHEMSHVIAARSRGVPAHLSFGTRMQFLVAQTQVTGIWGVERNQRYRVYLAGMGWDATVTSLALLATTLVGQTTRDVLKMIVLITIAQIAWQLMFFMKTDVYYAVANRLRCKNLMGDATTYLRTRRAGPSTTRAVPRVVRWYAYFMVLGRFASIAFLCGYTLPVSWVVASKGAALIGTGRFPSVLDGAVTVTVLTGSWGLFAFVFIRERLHRRAAQSRSQAPHDNGAARAAERTAAAGSATTSTA